MQNKRQKFILSERDETIELDDETHTYYVNGVAQKLSSTGILKHYFDPFDYDANVKRCANKRDVNHVKSDLRIAFVKTKWSMAAAVGSAVHRRIENFYNGEADGEDVYSLKWIDKSVSSYFDTNEYLAKIDAKYDAFLRIHKGILHNLKFLAAEYMIFGQVAGRDICGTIDALFEKSPGRVVIVDWKSNDNIDQYKFEIKNEKSIFGGRKMGNVAKYACQLHCYKFLLEKYYNVIVEDLFIVNVVDRYPTLIQIPDECDCFKYLSEEIPLPELNL